MVENSSYGEKSEKYWKGEKFEKNLKVHKRGKRHRWNISNISKNCEKLKL